MTDLDRPARSGDGEKKLATLLVCRSHVCCIGIAIGIDTGYGDSTPIPDECLSTMVEMMRGAGAGVSR